jgi:hypothetical protein
MLPLISLIDLPPASRIRRNVILFPSGREIAVDHGLPVLGRMTLQLRRVHLHLAQLGSGRDASKNLLYVAVIVGKLISNSRNQVYILQDRVEAQVNQRLDRHRINRKARRRIASRG